ncbi:uncharacterized protein N0V89_003405 [Didymosphaeria variabile]|uniref:F-box domain-containing protein n=1 Tax=Didymosphaeria variabile TaxID=1932322 RepID=A0A9W9CBG3_9PLEO|nr:uncharacterized protein N0V89_003405 [Didymosphaeria variabile]KAJ4355389.1 hypothetical protein N0V89_003405 [Didymosphaeria variabile]
MAFSLGNRTNPIPIPSDDAPLPSYIARHFNFGFDADDVSALISSIDASQDHGSTSTLPQLPAEILFHIVECVPIDHVLQWRLVCRGFRDCIDGPVMYNCIKRAEVFGIVASPSTLDWAGIPSDLQEILSHFRCRFERLEDSIEAPNPRKTNAKWRGLHAVFRIDDGWHEQLLRIETLFNDANKEKNWLYVLLRLHLHDFVASPRKADSFGKMRWCMRLDNAVLDLDFSIQALRENLILDLPSKKIMFEWKGLLLRFIQGETQLRTIMEQKRDSKFSFGHEEDCLRETRRRRIRASLNENIPGHSLLRWGLSTLPPLFGKRKKHEPAEEFRDLRRAEDSAMRFLMPLRRELAMSRTERDRLWQLAKDYVDMIDALENIEKQYTGWKNTLLTTTVVPSPIRFARSKNPFRWTEAERHRREARVLKWKAQQDNMQQVARLLEESLEAVSVPENAFDELGSDI